MKIQGYGGYFALSRSDSLEVGTGQHLFKKTKEAFVLDVKSVTGKVTGNVQLHLEGLQFIVRNLESILNLIRSRWGSLYSLYTFSVP